MNITCTANIPITGLPGLILGKSIFQALNSSLPTGSLAAGQSFSFPVTFNLTGYILNGESSSAPAVSPGVQTTAINILTTNGVTGYATEEPISVTGKSVSPEPFISMAPMEIDFSGIVLGSAAANAGSADTFIISNVGQSNMTILGYAFTAGSINSNATITNVTTINGVSVFDVNSYFTSTNLPAIGTAIPGGASVTVNAMFNTTVCTKS